VPAEAQPEGAAAWLAQAKTVFRNGEFFRAFDIAQSGLRAHPNDLGLAHLAVLSLANSGALHMAATQFDLFRLHTIQTVEMLSLRGRLATDRAFSLQGEARQSAFAEASGFYLQAQDLALATDPGEAYYPAINGAYLALLAGREAEAASRAAQILSMLGARLETARTACLPDRYWIFATAIEAHLLTGDIAAAQSLVPHAAAAAAGMPAALSSTWRQLDRILAAKTLPKATLSTMAPADAVHYLGHIIAPEGEPGRFPAAAEPHVARAIDQILAGSRIGVAYGALAAGADILLAEALLRHGATLHVVLPFARDDFVALSVRPSGETWVPRFDSCLAQASTVRYATEDRHLGDDHLFAYGSQIAMGLAVLYARHLHAGLRQIAVWDGVPNDGAVGTAADIGVWQRAGLPTTIIPVQEGAAPAPPSFLAALPRRRPTEGRRSARAMLFGDVSGFSHLTDAQLPGFAETVLAPLGRVIAYYHDRTDLVNTWGDGIFLVFSDAGAAAECALSLQAMMASVDLQAAGLPPTLSLRLGGHLGPAYELPDPIVGHMNFYGAHVSRAARIEPVVPGGCVYVTETFAAVLALSNADELACNYVGWTDMAKSYGPMRMFLLRPRNGRLEPTVLTDIEKTPIPSPKNPLQNNRP
jgi:class 3 adenylate cyclase